MTSDEDWIKFAAATATLMDAKACSTSFLEDKTRQDGRLLGQFRRTTIQQGILSKNANGSVLVTLRDPSSELHVTTVLAAINFQVGQPKPTQDSPAGSGDITVNVSFAVDDHSVSANGAILQCYLERILSECIQEAQEGNVSTEGEGQTNLHPLVLVPGKVAIGLLVAVTILQNAGNVGDACLLACVAALLDTRLPNRDSDIIIEDKTGRIWLQGSGIHTRRISFPILPIAITIGVFHSTDKTSSGSSERQWLVDPTQSEEASLSTIISVVVNLHKPDQILLMDVSSSGGSLRKSDLAIASRIAAARAKEVNNLLFGGDRETYEQFL